MSHLLTFLLIAAVLHLVAPLPGALAAPDESLVFARSVVSHGDATRLWPVFAKARRGEEVTVGVIGGSITAGAGASRPEYCYGQRVAAWWRTNFPGTHINFVNAGVGATGSDYGAMRAQQDLRPHHPDFVVVEFAVNDPNKKLYGETLEGLVRQILSWTNHPAVVLLFTMCNDGSNAQEWHAMVGHHYALPMVSFRDALWPEIQAGRLKWTDVEADVVHPNDRGHEYAARFVTSLLDRALKEFPASQPLPRLKPLPEPLFTDLFEHANLHTAAALKPITNSGWRLDKAKSCWQSEEPGSVIEFEVSGRAVLLMDWHIRGPMGMARVRVDDLPPVVRDAWFSATWGGYRGTFELARGLNPGMHRVRVELLAEKNPESTGHEYKIYGLGAAGVTNSPTPPP